MADANTAVLRYLTDGRCKSFRLPCKLRAYVEPLSTFKPTFASTGSFLSPTDRRSRRLLSNVVSSRIVSNAQTSGIPKRCALTHQHCCLCHSRRFAVTLVPLSGLSSDVTFIISKMKPTVSPSTQHPECVTLFVCTSCTTVIA